jgi:hypothetical protein
MVAGILSGLFTSVCPCYGTSLRMPPTTAEGSTGSIAGAASSNGVSVANPIICAPNATGEAIGGVAVMAATRSRCWLFSA